jgi:hypothetical protein
MRIFPGKYGEQGSTAPLKLSRGVTKGQCGWISSCERDDADVEHALRLFRLSYLQKRVRRDPTLDAAQSDRGTAAPGFSEQVQKALPGQAQHD